MYRLSADTLGLLMSIENLLRLRYESFITLHMLAVVK